MSVRHSQSSTWNCTTADIALTAKTKKSLPERSKYERQRVINLVRQFGLPPADQAAFIQSVANEVSESLRLSIAGVRPQTESEPGSKDTIRQRRSRAAKAAGLRAVRGTFYLNDNTLSALVREGIISRRAAENDLDLLDAVSNLIDRLAWE